MVHAPLVRQVLHGLTNPVAATTMVRLMKKVILLVVVLALVGAAVAAWSWSRTPARRLCSRMGELCAVEGSYDDFDVCVKDVSLFAEQLGEDRLERAAKCVDGAKSCSMAVGCLAGTGLDVLKDVAKDFLEGILKSGGNNP